MYIIFILFFFLSLSLYLSLSLPVSSSISFSLFPIPLAFSLSVSEKPVLQNSVSQSFFFLSLSLYLFFFFSLSLSLCRCCSLSISTWLIRQPFDGPQMLHREGEEMTRNHPKTTLLRSRHLKGGVFLTPDFRHLSSILPEFSFILLEVLLNFHQISINFIQF